MFYSIVQCRVQSYISTTVSTVQKIQSVGIVLDSLSVISYGMPYNVIYDTRMHHNMTILEITQIFIIILHVGPRRCV